MQNVAPRPDARRGVIDRRYRMTLELVADLAAVLDGVLDIAEGVRGNQGVAQQQQHREQQCKAFLCGWPGDVHCWL